MYFTRAQDIAIMSRCYPEFRTGMLQYVQVRQLSCHPTPLPCSHPIAHGPLHLLLPQGKLIFLLARTFVEPGSFPGAEHIGWCELAERIVLTLRAQPQYVQDDVRLQLGTVRGPRGGWPEGGSAL